MSSGNVRKGITQAKFNEDAVNIIFAEIAILSIAAGIYYQSWYVGGILFVGLLVGFKIKPLAIVLACVFSISWAYGTILIVQIFTDSTAALVVLGGIALLATGGAHMGGIEYVDDLTDTNRDSTLNKKKKSKNLIIKKRPIFKK